MNFEPSDPPGEWLGTYMPATRFHSEVLRAIPRAGRAWLPPYVAEFAGLARQRHRLADFDVLFTWELRATVATLLLQRITGHRAARVVSLNPTLKDWSLRALPLVRRALPDAACVVSFSTEEMERSRRLLRMPASSFRYVPRFAEPVATPARSGSTELESDFALALGHSNRDFPTLWRALEGSDVSVVMYHNRYLRRHANPHVRAVPQMLPADAELALVREARFHVIPLREAAFASGLTVLLRAMAHARAVVITDTTGVRDYVRDGETAVLVPPGDARALRDAMQWLWHDAAARERIGRNAAEAVRAEFATRRFAWRLCELAGAVMRPSAAVEEAVCVS
ncbi:MAG: glycosyltransferase family 4 protein [Candidatus Dormibacteraeota bacterium]|nr:glycosyltransferase family 4 protein [Candidatus Dormibacteraeota bacterium]